MSEVTVGAELAHKSGVDQVGTHIFSGFNFDFQVFTLRPQIFVLAIGGLKKAFQFKNAGFGEQKFQFKAIFPDEMQLKIVPVTARAALAQLNFIDDFAPPNLRHTQIGA